MNADFEEVKKTVMLWNGEQKVTVVVGGNGLAYLAMEGQAGSSIWGNLVMSRPQVYLMPINVVFLVLAHVIACHAGHLAMDMIDEWRTALLELPNVKVAMLDLGEDVAIGELIALMVEKVSLFQQWKVSSANLKRWNKEMNPKKFVLDMLLPILGENLIELVCIKMSIEPPRSVVHTNVPATPEVAKKAAKKSKITEADVKGHRSLTQFFKKKDCIG